MRVVITQLLCWPKGGLNECYPRCIERSEDNLLPVQKSDRLVFFFLTSREINKV